MAGAQGPFLVAVLLLLCPGTRCSSAPPACPEPCTCQRAPLLNCSSSGLSSVPQHVHDSVTELDLSHNLLGSVALPRPHRNLRNVRLGNNSIAHLSLCIDLDLGNRSAAAAGRHPHRSGPRSRRRCVSWAPTLQLLSVERNQLVQLPEGLEGSASIRVLQLSFNGISTLRPGDLRHLRQLEELHLQHNLITSLHPQMFQDLVQLRVLDLSFNLLTSLHPLTYLSLRSIGSDVRLTGNRWQCDCSVRSLARRMAYDRSKGLQAWDMVCAFPSTLSGRDLLQLEEDDLNCVGTEDSPELHRDVTVHGGSGILLSCSRQDSLWWTPSGQASVSQPQAALFISDVTERDTGLYVCMSEEHEVVSVFNLQLSRIGPARRKTRSLPRHRRQLIPHYDPNRIEQGRNQRVTQSDLALAVCLSILFTFLIAFIFGVLARPYIDVHCIKYTNTKRSTSANSSAEQQQYENEAFSDGEEPEEIETHRERRVQFGAVNFREDTNEEYYNTVASGNQESIPDYAVIECEVARTEEHEPTAGDSRSEYRSSPEDNQGHGSPIYARCTNKVKYENISERVEPEDRRSLSSFSDCSLSDQKEFQKDQMTQGDLTTPKSLQLADESVHQRLDLPTSNKVEVHQMSLKGSGQNPGFSSEAFADCSQHTNSFKQEDEEQFEFSDSFRSTSARSSIAFGSFNDSKQIVLPTPDKQNRDDVSSCSPYLSEDEPTYYNVNPDPEEEEDTENNHNKYEVPNTGLKQGDRPEQTFSSQPSDSDSEQMPYTVKEKGEEKSINEYNKLSSRSVTGERDTREKIRPNPRTKWRGVSLGVTSFGRSLDTRAPSPPKAYSSSSSSESEAEITGPRGQQNKGRVSQIKNNLDIIAPLPASDYSSSDESKDETTKDTKKRGQGDVYVTGVVSEEDRSIGYEDRQITPIKRGLDIRVSSMPTDESADRTMDYVLKQREMHIARLQFQESQTASHDSDTRWPALDLEHIPHIKRRLDIKSTSMVSDSSSGSVSEDETTHHADRPGTVDIAKFPLQKSQTRHDPDAKWPSLELEHIPPIKRRLDIKAPSPLPDSSSSNDSRDETTGHTEKHISGILLKESQTASQDSGTRWPALDLEHIPHIKRRLDIKAPSPPPVLSSGCDSEQETIRHAKRPEKVRDVKLSLQKSQTRHDPDAKGAGIDLEHIPTIKRRLDIKAPSPPPDSSSGSDSDDETTHHADSPEKVSYVKLPLQKSETTRHDPDAKWPLLDLEHIPPIKRRLDIKAPSPPPDSSSSNDSQDETTGHTEKHISGILLKESQTASQDSGTRWPALDLEHIPHIKRRLDIKVQSPPPYSSSSSDSEDEKIHHADRPGTVDIAKFPLHKSQTRHDPDAKWPSLDLEHIPPIKRRLDIKAPSPPPDLSSSSDSEDETTHHAMRPEMVSDVKVPLQKSETTSHDSGTRWPALDLEHIPHIKRRLDIRAPSPPPDSSSGSDSDDETTHHADRPGTVDLAKFPLQKTETTRHDPDAKWPSLDLEQIPPIKRRLDIKVQSPPPDSSSSSDSEDKATDHTKKQRPGVVNLNSCYSGSSSDEQDDISNSSINPDQKWPEIGLSSVPLVKRRLDIKTYSHSAEHSSSSDDGDSGTTDLSVKGGVGITTREQRKTNPGIPYIRRRLDIKAPSPQPDLVLDSISEDYQQSGSNSSKRKGEGENRDHNAELGMGVSAISKAVEGSPKTPVINISPHPKTDHNIKLEKYRVITDDLGGKQTDDNISTTPEINPELQSRWANMNLGISRFRKHLDITSNSHVSPNLPTSPSPDSPSSWNSESGTGNQSSRTRLTRRGDGMQEIPHTDSSLTLENKPGNVPSALKSQDHEDFSPPTISETSSRDTAFTGFGTPYVRRYLDIRVREKAPASPPLHQLPDSPSGSQSEGVSTESAGNRWRGTSQQSVVPDRAAPQNSTSLFVARADDVRPEYRSGTEEVERKTGVEHKSETSEEGETSDSMRPHLTLTNIPYVKRALDIRAPLQREFSSKSNSEDETTDFRVPNLNFGVPRPKRRLDIKAPSPEPSDSSSSCSESGNKVTGYKRHQSREASIMSGMTDYDSQITYKRSILKGPLTLGNSLSPSQPTDRAQSLSVAQGLSHSVGVRYASPAPWRVPSDDIVKKKTEPQHTIDEELPPEMRWTGIGRHLSGFPMSSPRRLEAAAEKVGLPSPAEPELSPPVSSRIDSDDNITQDSGRADVPLMHKYSHPLASRVSPAPSRAFDRFDNTSGSTNEIFRALSVDREGKKGLGALKTMSSKRLQWETEDKDIDGV